MTDDYDKLRQERIEAAKAEKKVEQKRLLKEKVKVALIVAAALIVLFLLGGFITLLTWNVGVVAIVAACGGAVSKISFGAALGLNLIWMNVVWATGQIRKAGRDNPNPTNITNILK